MRVLHVIPSMSPVHGGPTEALGAMERALAAQGVVVETATTDDDGPGRRRQVPLGQPVRENGVDRWYFAKWADFYKPAPALGAWLRREIRRFDLVHAHALFSYTTTAAARAARRAGVPLVVRPLGTLAPYGLAQRRPWAKRLSLACVERPLLEAAAAVHFTSEQEARQARALGFALREAVIPLGVELPPRAASGSGLQLLYLSRLDPKKNLEGLLAACALLAPAFPGLHLTVAGSGDPAYEAALHARARALGLGTRVHWAGALAGEAKARALCDAGIFVLPSFSENFGIAAAEALAAGLPCVLGEGVAIAADVAGAGAGLACATAPEDITAALRRIMADEGLRQAMGERARQLAGREYSTQAMGRRLVALYSEILSR